MEFKEWIELPEVENFIDTLQNGQPIHVIMYRIMEFCFNSGKENGKKENE